MSYRYEPVGLIDSVVYNEDQSITVTAKCSDTSRLAVDKTRLYVKLLEFSEENGTVILRFDSPKGYPIWKPVQEPEEGSK